jgi:hypothetical protein
LQDLPEYTAGCVFILDEDGWRGYWENGNWTLPGWLEELLSTNVPEISDYMADWFSPIDDEESTTYVVNMNGDIREHKIYTSGFLIAIPSCLIQEKKLNCSHRS